MTQKEFERQMQIWNQEQTAANHPFIDKQTAINRKRDEIKAEIATLRARYNLLGMQWGDLQRERREINRRYHEMKHDFIMAHPREETIQD